MRPGRAEPKAPGDAALAEQPALAGPANRRASLVIRHELVARDFGTVELHTHRPEFLAAKRVNVDRGARQVAREQRIEIGTGDTQAVDGDEDIACRQTRFLCRAAIVNDDVTPTWCSVPRES